MENAEVKQSGLGDIDLYSNQLKYNTYVVKKKKVYAVLFFVSSIISLVSLFLLPMYKYQLLGKKRGQMKIIGDYTAEYIIEKYFNMTLGPHTILNTAIVVSIVAMMILSVYLIIGSVINLFVKKMLDKKVVAKMFSYGMLEVISVALFLCLFLSMVFCKVDAFGNVENITGFWLVFASSIMMTCTSISLSSK